MVARSILLFVLAAVAEIGGAWLVWQGVREQRGWLWAGLGVIALGMYGTLAAHHLRDVPPRREHAANMLELAKTSPAVLAAFLADLERFQNQLTDIIVRRQGMQPDDEMAPLISALALTAVRSGIEKWASGEASETDDTPMPYVERAAALVNSIFTK